MSVPALYPPFNLGQTVYLASAYSYSEVEVPCPICFGKLKVTLVLGNGEAQEIECDYCGKGYEGPRGFVMDHRAVSSVTEHTVTGLHSRDEGWDFDLSGSRHASARDRALFGTREEAEARRIELHAEAEKEAENRMLAILKGKKKGFTWTAGYHRSEIREHERKIGWHKGKLCELVEKQKKAAVTT